LKRYLISTGRGYCPLVAKGLSLLIGFSASLALAANPLPADRAPGGGATWNGKVGVPGGIPTRTTIFTTIPPGATAATIQSAINSCPAGQVVQLSAGTYDMGSSSINIFRSNITLRGAGAGQTILNFSGTNYVTVGDFNTWYWTATSNPDPAAGNPKSWTGGLSQGSTNLTVASTTGYSVGQLIMLDQLNDPDTSLVGVEGVTANAYYSVAFPHTGEDRAQHQVSRITAISGNVITISEPVYMPNYSATFSPQVWRFQNQPTVGVGVENLSIDGLFRFHAAYGSWITGCNVKWNNAAGGGDIGFLAAYWSARCTIKKCLVTTDNNQISSEDYGIETRVCSGMLIEDNIVDKIGVALQFSGCSGSVVAYNYINNVISGGGQWMAAGLLNHGGWPNMVLCEGNIAPEWGLDNTDSPSGYNTAHRNWFQGVEQGNTRPLGNTQAICVAGMNRHCNAIGNVLGTSGVSYATYQDGPGCLGSGGGKRIYSVGFFTAECGGYDATTASTLIRAYNWNQKTNLVADGFTAADIPSSYYLTSKPAWFGNLAWPAIDPDNPSASRNATRIPAGYRYVNGSDPPPGGTPAPTPTATPTSTATPASSATPTATATATATGTPAPSPTPSPASVPALVQTNGKDSASASSHTVTLPNVAAHSVLLCGVRVGAGPTITNVSDSSSNSWTQVGTAEVDASGNRLYVYKVNDAAASAALTVTVTLSGSSTARIAILEASGCSNVTPVDRTAQGDGASTVPDSGATGTTTQPNQLLIGFIETDGGGSSCTAGPGWTQQQAIATSKLFLETRMVTSSGSYNAVATLGASDTWAAFCVTLRGANAPSAPTGLHIVP